MFCDEQSHAVKLGSDFRGEGIGFRKGRLVKADRPRNVITEMNIAGVL
jgi:hypothetical protein